MSPATTSAHGSDTLVHTATISPVTLELQPTSNQLEQSGPQVDRLGLLFEMISIKLSYMQFFFFFLPITQLYGD